MNDLVLTDRASEWRRLKALVLDSVSSPITRRVYNLGLDEFFAWYGQEARPGFTKATVAAWRVALEARGLGAVSINVRITAVRKLAIEAADNGLLAPELASGIIRVKGVASKGVRLGNWLSARQAQALLNTPDATAPKGLRDRAILAVLLGCGLRRSEVGVVAAVLALHVPAIETVLGNAGVEDGPLEIRVVRPVGCNRILDRNAAPALLRHLP
jgi:site-specific recombinase XerD